MHRWLGIFLVVMIVLPTHGLASPREIDVPLLQQVGDKHNCGPTAAAMTLGAYGVSNRQAPGGLEGLRNAMGQWSWDAYPIRRLRLPGTDAGASPPNVVQAMLNRFSPRGLSFHVDAQPHPWLPAELWALTRLRAQLESGRPLTSLVTSRVIWGQPSAPGLHWVVVRGLRSDGVVINDPADQTRRVIPLSTFLDAWSLDGVFAALFDRYTALVPNSGVLHRRRVATRIPQSSGSRRR